MQMLTTSRPMTLPWRFPKRIWRIPPAFVDILPPIRHKWRAGRSRGIFCQLHIRFYLFAEFVASYIPGSRILPMHHPDPAAHSQRRRWGRLWMSWNVRNLPYSPGSCSFCFTSEWIKWSNLVHLLRANYYLIENWYTSFLTVQKTTRMFSQGICSYNVKI